MRKRLTELGVELRHFNIIYRLVEDVRNEIDRRLPPSSEDEIVGEADVHQDFVVTERRRKMPVAGCLCTRGELELDEAEELQFRVLREDGTDKPLVLFDGRPYQLRHFKDVVTRIVKEQECGIAFDDASLSVHAGDRVVCYRTVPVARHTSWQPPGF